MTSTTSASASKMPTTAAPASKTAAPTWAKVGEGVTQTLWTDRLVGTIIAVSPSGKTLTCQFDRVTLDPSFKRETIPGGFAGHVVNNDDQKWIIERDTTLATFTARLRKDGRYYTPKGRPVHHGRFYHYDFNF